MPRSESFKIQRSVCPTQQVWTYWVLSTNQPYFSNTELSKNNIVETWEVRTWVYQIH